VVNVGAYKYIQKTFQKEYKTGSREYKARVISWRKGQAMTRVSRPTNLTRARRLGYKASQGYVVVRVRIKKGRRMRRKPKGGRKERHAYLYVQPGLSHQAIAEQRANRKFNNLEVLNSYWIGEDGNFKYFEVILADKSKKSVKDKAIKRKGRAFRGLTSKGKRARGRRKKRGV
jgi:large subunit ribosomal protein L15e